MNEGDRYTQNRDRQSPFFQAASWVVKSLSLGGSVGRCDSVE